MKRIPNRLILIVSFIMSSFLTMAMNIDHWETIVDAGNTWKYFVCDTVPPPANWQSNDFNDNCWLSGPGGFGYGDNDDATVIRKCWSVIMRIEFNIRDTAQIEMLMLDIDFDDTFVAWINGVEVGRYGITGTEPKWNTQLYVNREALLYQHEQPYSIFNLKNEFRHYLKNGSNVLCIQVNNKDINSSDLSAIGYLFAAFKNSTVNYQPLPDWFRAPETSWNSGLPVFVINTNCQGIPDEPKVTAHLGIINHTNGTPNNPFDAFNEYDGIIGIELRGSSSQLFPKKSYGFETWSTAGLSKSVSLAGLPAESDWILYGPYTDKTLIRNALTYSLFNDFLHYSPKTRFVDLYINGENKGLYLLTEKIKCGVNRVNITKLTDKDIYDLDVTGGYIIKFDKSTGSGSSAGFYSDYLPYSGSHYPFIRFAYPAGEDILPEQAQYIHEQFDAFETALHGDNYKDPIKGYRSFIDVNSFIDYFIVNELSKNVDGFRISSYLYKDRDDIDMRFHAGPVWDYDLAFGNANYANAQCTDGWQYTIDGDDYPIPFWWAQLMTDDYFTGCLKCRWEELRNSILSTESINNRIDSMVNVIGESAKKNFNIYQILSAYVWPNPYIGDTYAAEIDHLKTWIYNRSVYMDENLPGVCLATKAEKNMPAGFSASVYPNPSSDGIHVEADNSANDHFRIQIVDMTGHIVYASDNISDSNIRLFIPLTDGIYQVIISNGKTKTSIKAIVL